MSNTTNDIELPKNWRRSAFTNLSIREAIAFLQSTGSNAQSIDAVICDNAYGADAVLEPYRQALIKFLTNQKNGSGRTY